MDKGASLYIKLHEKDLPPGTKIELLKRDDTSSNADVGKRLAQELITRDHVRILAGVVASPIAAAVAPLTAEAKVPLVIMNAAGSAIPRISPYVVRVSFTIWQQAYPMGKWAAQQGSKKGYTAVSDFIPGHDGEAGFAKGFTDGGGEMLGGVQFPPANPDFAPFIQRIKDAKPDVVFVFVPGGKQATQFMKAWTDLGLTAAGIKLVGTQDIVTDDELPNMGEAPLGIVTSGIYSVADKRPQNQAFLDAWTKEYGEAVIPNYVAVGGWDGMAAIFDVIKADQRRLRRRSGDGDPEELEESRQPPVARSRSIRRRATSCRPSTFAASRRRTAGSPMSNSTAFRWSRTPGRSSIHRSSGGMRPVAGMAHLLLECRV